MSHRQIPSLLLLCLAALTQTAHAADPQPAPLGAPILLDTVEVTATAGSAQDERQNASTAKIIVSREDLEKMDAATIGEILRQLPGVNLSADSAGGRGGRARPADRLEPRILVDGEALPGGNRSAVRLPAELIERIEIIKTSTAEFPAGPGGTVNIILRDVPPKRAATFRAGLSHDGEAFGGRLGGTHGAREGETGVLWIGFADSRPRNESRSVAREHFSGGARDDWDVERDATEARDNSLHLMPRFTRTLAPGVRLTLSPFLMATEGDRRTDTQRLTYLDPVAGSGLTADGRVQEQESSRRINARLAAEWKQRVAGQGETSARLSLQGEAERRSRERSEFDSADALLADTRTLDRRSGQEIALTLKRSLPLAAVHLATFGLEARYKTATDRKRESVNGVASALGAQARAESRERLLALWAQDEWQMADKHLLTPGLRLQIGDNRVVDGLGAAVADAHTAWLPSLAYLYQPNPRWNLRASAALADKAPGVAELSPVIRTTTGENTLSNPDRAGNPALAPETTATLQLGVEHFLPQQRGSAGLNLYLRQIDDKIQKRTLLEAGRFVERPFNLASARETSLVADFKWKPASLPVLTLRGNAATNRIRLDDPGAPFVRQESPRHSANLGADVDWTAQRITAGGSLSYTSAFTREANPATRQTQRARTQLDVYAVKKLDRTLSVRLSIDNLTRARRGDDSAEYAGGLLTRLETDRVAGVRLVNLSLEGRW